MAATKNLTQNLFSKHTILHILDRAWYIKATLAVEEVDRSEWNTFRFLFHSKEDRNRILERGPWLVNKVVMVIKE